jgi:hypothetical protein
MERSKSMETDAQVQQRVCAEPSMESLEVAPAIEQLFGDAKAVSRLESNIAQWMKYLPQDCINRMIEMRWDLTT